MPINVTLVLVPMETTPKQKMAMMVPAYSPACARWETGTCTEGFVGLWRLLTRIHEFMQRNLERSASRVRAQQKKEAGGAEGQARQEKHKEVLVA